MTQTLRAPEQTVPDSRLSGVRSSPVTAVVVIWLSSALMAIFAPDMVTGSQQEHLPLAALTVWVWTVLATAYVLMTGRRSASIAFIVGVCAVWIAALVAVVATPPLVTGTDPTSIPLGALFTPIVAAAATGLLAVHAAAQSHGT